MSFENISFSSEIKEQIKRMNYDSATKVQYQAIPAILNGKNVVVKSHTGSGKTAAFGIAISERIFTGKSSSALIVCPTRELAVQVKDELRKINLKTRLNVCAFYGGHGMSSEKKDVKNGIDILCATPGRLLDHFRNNYIDPKQFDTVVLDEADRILDMGFIHDLRKILEFVEPKNTHLFSATLDGSISNLIAQYIPSFEEIILEEEIVGKKIFEKHLQVSKGEKLSALLKIISEAKGERVLVFMRTKRSADFLSKKLFHRGLRVSCIHGNKSSRARQIALNDFRLGKINVMIATDIAARGLQIDNIMFVVNYDLANDSQTHLHRIGRTGRMNQKGYAITFVGEDGNITAPNRFYPGSGENSGFGGRNKRQSGFNGSKRNVNNRDERNNSRMKWNSHGFSNDRSSFKQ